MADALGCHWVTVSKLERGETPISQGWADRLGPILGLPAPTLEDLRQRYVDAIEARPQQLANIEAKLDRILNHLGIGDG